MSDSVAHAHRAGIVLYRSLSQVPMLKCLPLIPLAMDSLYIKQLQESDTTSP